MFLENGFPRTPWLLFSLPKDRQIHTHSLSLSECVQPTWTLAAQLQPRRQGSPEAATFCTTATYSLGFRLGRTHARERKDLLWLNHRCWGWVRGGRVWHPCHLLHARAQLRSVLSQGTGSWEEQCHYNLWLPGRAWRAVVFLKWLSSPLESHHSLSYDPFSLGTTAFAHPGFHILIWFWSYTAVADKWLGNQIPSSNPGTSWVTSTPMRPKEKHNEMKPLAPMKQMWEYLCSCFYLFNYKDWLQQFFDE